MKLAITTDTHHGFSKGDKREPDLQEKENARILQEISAQKPDLFIHLGDFGSHCVSNRRDYWSLVRSTPGMADIPCLTVMGNHDWWEQIHSTQNYHPEDTLAEMRGIFKEYNITYLGDGSIYQKDHILIGGTDGWYYVDPSTNDRDRIPGYNYRDGKRWLKDRNNKDFTKLLLDFEHAKTLASPSLTTILITHFGFLKECADNDWKSVSTHGPTGEYFGANPGFEDHLENVDYLFFGHSHQYFDGFAKNGKTKAHNPGSDYTEPKYTFLEV
jgi:predicted phosphodiesterase